MSRVFIYSYAFRPSIGGMENMCRYLAEEFSRLGHDVVVATETLSDGSKDEDSYRIVRRPSWRDLWSLCRWSDCVLTVPISLKNFWLLLLAGRPIFVHHPNALIGSDGRRRFVDLAKRFLSYFSYNFVASDYMATEMPGSLKIANAYDDAIFKNYGEDRPNELIFVGRLDSVKGADTLLIAFQMIKAEFPSVTLTIVGDGPDRERLLALSNSCGFQHGATFVGARDSNAIAKLLNSHRILVVPSKYKEPFGIVALEGLACGCLPIVSKQGGLIDAIGSHGLTFENGDARDLYTQLKIALSDKSVYSHLLQNVDQHLSRHTKAVVANKYMQAMNSVCIPGMK